MTRLETRSARILLTVTGLLLFAGATTHAQQPDRGSDLLVSTAWLAEHSGDSGVSVLHVGADRAGYDAGHIAGARFVALSDLVVAREGVPNELPPAADLAARFGALGIGDTGRVVLYGDEKGLLAARAFFTLDYLGHGDSAALLDGGLERWRAEGRPTSTEAPVVAPRRFTPRLNPAVLVTLPVVRDIAWLVAGGEQDAWALIDARPEAQFTGADAGPAIDRPGHIPGAASLYWQRALAAPDNPVLRPIAELRRLYAGAGAKPGRTIVTYCRTGVQASFAYFVARYLGYPAKMYDGSFLEWSRTEGMPVARGAGGE